MAKLPPLTIPDEGHNYGTDLLGHRVCTGAKMGIPDRLPDDPTQPLKLRMVEVHVSVDGYISNGTYFGLSQGRRYHVESVEPVLLSQQSWWTGSDPGMVLPVRLFVTAKNRAEAKELVRQMMPNATFFR